MDTSVGADDVEAVWSRLQKAMTDPDGLQNPYPLLREMHRYGDRLRTPSGVHAVFGYNRVNELTRSLLFKKDTAVIFNSAFAGATDQQKQQLRDGTELSRRTIRPNDWQPN